MARQPGPDCPVDEIPRRDTGQFRPKYQLIHEFAFANSGAQKVIPANPRRIRAVLYALASNSGAILLGGEQLTPSGNVNANGAGIDALIMEPGTGWEIDDSTAAIFAISAPGTGDQSLEWSEAMDREAVPK